MDNTLLCSKNYTGQSVLLITEASYLYFSSSTEQRFLRIYVTVEDSNLLGGKKAHNPCTDLLQAEGFPES